MPDSFMNNFIAQLVASAAQMQPTREDRLLLAKVQTQCALGMLSGEPNPKMARLYLEDALLHLREAEG